MQNFKGIVKFFTWTLVIVCLIQLSFTFVARYVEGKADEVVAKYENVTVPGGLTPVQQVLFKDSVEQVARTTKRAYLDSVANDPILDWPGLRDFYTYKFCRDHALSLGLDLKGGMSLILEIKEDEVLRNLADNNNSKIFDQAIKDATAAQQNAQVDFLTLFQREFERANPNAKLSTIFGSSYKGKITNASTNDEVIKIIREDFNGAIKSTFNVLKTRIDQFGVASPNISLQENTGRIILELPGVEDPARVRKLLQTTAQLEFWETYEMAELGPYLNTLYEKAQSLGEKKDTTATATAITDTAAGSGFFGADTTLTATTDTAKTDTTAKKADEQKVNPLARIFQLNLTQDNNFQKGPVIGYAYGRDTARVNALLAREELRGVFPANVPIKLLWGAHPIDKKNNTFALYAIRKTSGSNVAQLTGEVITDAYQSYSQGTGTPEVNLTMNALGASKWEQLTAAAFQAQVMGQTVNKSIAIVLDDRVFSAPTVQAKISGGKSNITGINSLDEAIDLANILKSGKLEAGTRIIEEQVVGPSLGKQSIRAGLTSLLVGFIMVFLFMVLYYSTSGIIANISMLLNMFLLVALMVSFGAAFTLPAMAGILLTLAMAVDANVIINERVREEIVRGKGLRLAVEEGYAHSYNAIIDGQLTTMVVAIVLMVFGLGPIYGFGFVLFWGILTSLFTAVLVSRVLFESAFNRNYNISFGNKFTMNLFKNINFDFIGKRKISYTVSAIIFAVSLASIFLYGFDYGVDFKGGRSYVIQFDKDVKTEEVAKALEPTLDGAPQIKTYGSNNQISITTAYLIDSAGANIDSIVEHRVYEGVTPFFQEKPTFDQFRTKNVKSSVKIGSTVADDIRASALWSLFFGLAGVFIYIFVRFRKWEYATGAIVALTHDPVLVLGAFSLLREIMPFSLEIDQNIVAAVLTLIGYSVNDTVVVFDRIREYIGLHPTRTVTQNVNDSINSTLSRTIMTVFTVLIVSLILFIFGGTAIRGFSFALIIGLLIGTYSSIFIASPVMVDLMNRKKKQ